MKEGTIKEKNFLSHYQAKPYRRFRELEQYALLLKKQQQCQQSADRKKTF